MFIIAFCPKIYACLLKKKKDKYGEERKSSLITFPGETHYLNNFKCIYAIAWGSKVYWSVNNDIWAVEWNANYAKNASVIFF